MIEFSFSPFQVTPVATKLPIELTAITATDKKLYVATKEKRNNYKDLFIYEPKHAEHDDFEFQMYKKVNSHTMLKIAICRNDMMLTLSYNGGVTVHIYDPSTSATCNLINTVPKSKYATDFAFCINHLGEIVLAVVQKKKVNIMISAAGSCRFDEYMPCPEVSAPDSILAIDFLAKDLLIAGTRDEYFLLPLEAMEQSEEATALVDQPQGVGSFSSRTFEYLTGRGLYQQANMKMPRPISLCSTGAKSGRAIIIKMHNPEQESIESNLFGVQFDDVTLVFEIRDRTKIVQIKPKGCQPSSPRINQEADEFVSENIFVKIKWSQMPVKIIHSSPYLLALLANNTIEVRSIMPKSICVQKINIDVPNIAFICTNCSFFGSAYVANSTNIYYLNSQSNAKSNVQLLIDEKQFDLAAQVALHIASDTISQRKERVRKIKRAHAVFAFTQNEFELAFRLCSDIKADVLFAIGMVPNLHSASIKSIIQYDFPLPNALSDQLLVQALLALTVYLNDVRTYLVKQMKAIRDEAGNIISENQKEEYKRQLEIVDTTLLKCYLETDEKQCASLLRLDNNCNLLESETMLRAKNKIEELLCLYERRNLHEQALDLLKQEACNHNSKLNGTAKAISYLQTLGQNNLDLIFKHAGWLLKDNANEGVKIFIGQNAECESLNRKKVLKYLQSSCPDAVLPYLEHLVFEWSEEHANIREQLALHYLTIVKDGINNIYAHLGSGEQIPKPGEELGGIGEVRRKLLKLLRESKFLAPELLIFQLPKNAMFEERAILYGKIGKHPQALSIYTQYLHDDDAAEEYCLKYYSPNNEKASQIFNILIKLYADPTTAYFPSDMEVVKQNRRPNLNKVLKLMNLYADKIDVAQILENVADNTAFDKVWPTLLSVTNQAGHRRKFSQCFLPFCKQAQYQAEKNLQNVQKKKIIIEKETICSKCNKKISDSAFAIYPQGMLVHYYCHLEIQKEMKK